MASSPGPRSFKTRRRSQRDADAQARPAFSSFFERNAVREARRKRRRRTLLVSIGIHVAVIVGLIVYSLWHVDELWSPSVSVSIFSPAQAPADVVRAEAQRRGEAVGEAPVAPPARNPGTAPTLKAP
jgi:hypothetical protein